MYNGAGNVPPAPLSATTGVEEVVIADEVVVVVEVGVVEVVPRGVVVVVVTTRVVVGVVVEIAWVVEVG